MSHLFQSFDLLAVLLVSLGLVVLPLLSLLRHRTTPSSARADREGSTVFLPGAIVQRALALADPLVAFLARRQVNPDTITWLSVLLGAVAGIAVAAGSLGLATALFLLSSLCDLLDGGVARARQLASRRGAVLDSVLDRYVEAFLHLGLLWFFNDRPALQLLCLLSLFGSMMVTYSTAKAEAVHLTPPRGWMKRAERLVWLNLGLFAGAWSAVAGLPAWVPPAVAVTLVAVFANLSAALRLRALSQAADSDRP